MRPWPLAGAHTRDSSFAPVLFSGSIRYNLDPFGEHSGAAERLRGTTGAVCARWPRADEKLWSALERVHLDRVLRDMKGTAARSAHAARRPRSSQRGHQTASALW